jgi:hypothetical protein
MPAPRFLGYQALLGEPKPINWKGIGQALWDSNLNSPIRGAYNLMNTPYDVLAGGPSPEMDQAVADSFDAGGGITVGSAMVPKPSNALSMGIKAYHGSPHSFDKFSMDKIGTGEGAQAYGHGLYFAENEGVAKGYRENLASGYRIDGKEYNASTTKAGATTPGHHAADALDRFKGDKQAAIEWLNGGGPADKEAAKVLQKAKSIEPWNGSMYEVNIDADPNAFLDWDKPLSEQPETVRRLAGWTPEAEAQYKAALKSDTDSLYAALTSDAEYAPTKMPRPPGSFPMDSTGAQFYESSKLVPGEYSDKVTAAQKLKEAGIPGIKYLDAGSRGAGDGTRNYVVFDDKLISIVKKYGIAGASAMLGYNLLEGVDKSQAAELQQADTHHQYTSWLNSGGI